jgi:hypothetical protein
MSLLHPLLHWVPKFWVIDLVDFTEMLYTDNWRCPIASAGSWVSTVSRFSSQRLIWGHMVWVGVFFNWVKRICHFHQLRRRLKLFVYAMSFSLQQSLLLPCDYTTQKFSSSGAPRGLVDVRVALLLNPTRDEQRASYASLPLGQSSPSVVVGSIGSPIE